MVLGISNAAFLSDWTKQEITLPVDEDLFYELLQERIRNSKVKKENKASVIVDVNGTYGHKDK